jgi:hypothetical protein
MEVFVTIELIEDDERVVSSGVRRRVFGGFFTQEQYDHVALEVGAAFETCKAEAKRQLEEERARAVAIVAEHEELDRRDGIVPASLRVVGIVDAEDAGDDRLNRLVLHYGGDTLFDHSALLDAIAHAHIENDSDKVQAIATVLRLRGHVVPRFAGEHGAEEVPAA